MFIVYNWWVWEQSMTLGLMITPYQIEQQGLQPTLEISRGLCRLCSDLQHWRQQQSEQKRRKHNIHKVFSLTHTKIEKS